MSSRVISINNQKGGVGKTTTTLAMAKTLIQKGHKVLILDCDGSSTTLTKILSQQVGIDYKTIKTTLTDLLLLETLGRDTAEITDSVKISCPEGYDFLPSDNKLVSISTALSTQNDLNIRFGALKHIVSHYRPIYDYIILDAAPVLDIFSVNQLVAADELLIVSQCQQASRDAIHELLNTVKTYVYPINENLLIRGILLTMLDGRAKYGKQQIEEMKDEFKDMHIFNNVIPRATDAERYVSTGNSIITQSPRGKVSLSYQAFIEEYLER